MTAKECIMGRRSIRKFKDTPVDHEVVNEIIEAASYAPSWKHSQIARYVAVEGALKDKIADECTDDHQKCSHADLSFLYQGKKWFRKRWLLFHRQKG